jgi:hypothetical protein
MGSDRSLVFLLAEHFELIGGPQSRGEGALLKLQMKIIGWAYAACGVLAVIDGVRRILNFRLGEAGNPLMLLPLALSIFFFMGAIWFLLRIHTWPLMGIAAAIFGVFYPPIGTVLAAYTFGFLAWSLVTGRWGAFDHES